MPLGPVADIDSFLSQRGGLRIIAQVYLVYRIHLVRSHVKRTGKLELKSHFNWLSTILKFRTFSLLFVSMKVRHRFVKIFAMTVWNTYCWQTEARFLILLQGLRVSTY